jgi:signal transduction histidine kinase
MLEEGIGGTLTETQREFVGTIRVRGEQLLQLILDLLDLSKLESGTIVLRRTALQVRDVVAESIATLEPAARKRNVSIALEAEEGTPDVSADADRLRQVFVNLLDNAVKFSPEGSVVTVTARVEHLPDADLDGFGAALLAPTARRVVVRVADQGRGIPEDQLQRVFDAFYQVDQSTTREHGGAGLGLSIVKRIVEAHEGQISVETNTPRGAMFVVQLPTARPRLAGDLAGDGAQTP